MMMSPPLPPSPPEGPPRGTNFSRRNAMQPLPPPPAITRILASSMNMTSLIMLAGLDEQTEKPRPEDEAVGRRSFAAAAAQSGPRQLVRVTLATAASRERNYSAPSGSTITNLPI